MTYVETPPPASVLLSVEIPEQGGDTYFADQCAAYDAVPNELKSRIHSLTIKHDAAHTSIGNLRHGYEPFEDPRDAPGAVHPIVIEHEETGRKALYLGRREWAYVPGLELDESEALLDELWQYAAQVEYVWTQDWQVSDIIIWDNRRVLHRRDDFDQDSRRLMKRCQVLARTHSPQKKQGAVFMGKTLLWVFGVLLVLVLAALKYSSLTRDSTNARVAEEIRQNPAGDRAARTMLLSLEDGTMLPVNFLHEGHGIYGD